MEFLAKLCFALVGGNDLALNLIEVQKTNCRECLKNQGHESVEHMVATHITTNKSFGIPYRSPPGHPGLVGERTMEFALNYSHFNILHGFVMKKE